MKVKVTTLRTLAQELGISYWQIRHALRQGYVKVQRDAQRRKVYLRPDEVEAIKRHFGVSLARCAEDSHRGLDGIAQ
jgi:hypothetical protein